MADGFLLGRVRFELTGKNGDEAGDDLSAIAVDGDGNLWTASDEMTSLLRLRPTDRGAFGKAKSFDLAAALALTADDEGVVEEIDIEGLDAAGGAVWLTGSHTSTRKAPKGKSVRKDLERLAEVQRRPNRFVIARVALEEGKPAGAVRLPFTDQGNPLTEALLADPHLGPFLHIPRPNQPALQLASKENGFDIEGLAVVGGRVFLGLRGPVLRGLAAIILEIEPEPDAGDGGLALKPVGDGARLYRKHLIDLEGMGVRELCRDGDDLLILAGPTLDLTGLQTVWRLRAPAKLDDDSLTLAGDKRLSRLFDLPLVHGGDKAEGLTLYDGLGEPGLMVVYDSPVASRKREGGQVLADVFARPAD